MNRTLARIATTLGLATALFTGCATSGATSGGGSSLEAVVLEDGEKLAVTEISTRTGIGETYVNTAVSAAKYVYGGGAKTAEAKAKAAEQGVTKAAAQASADGKAFTPAQKSSLLSGVSDLIKL